VSRRTSFGKILVRYCSQARVAPPCIADALLPPPEGRPRNRWLLGVANPTPEGRTRNWWLLGEARRGPEEGVGVELGPGEPEGLVSDELCSVGVVRDETRAIPGDGHSFERD